MSQFKCPNCGPVDKSLPDMTGRPHCFNDGCDAELVVVPDGGPEPSKRRGRPPKHGDGWRNGNMGYANVMKNRAAATKAREKVFEAGRADTANGKAILDALEAREQARARRVK